VIDILVRNSIAKSALATPATLGVNPDEARQSHAFAPLRSKEGWTVHMSHETAFEV
jgi:hypothetical protein